MGLVGTLQGEGVELNESLVALDKGLASKHPLVRSAAVTAGRIYNNQELGYISHSDGSGGHEEPDGY